MFCSKCGAKVVDENGRFCSSCGAPLSSEPAEAAKTRQIKLVRKGSMICGLLIMEVNLLDDRGTCVGATALSNGGSAFFECECGVKYHIEASITDQIGGRLDSDDISIEAGDNNLTIVLGIKMGFKRGKIVPLSIK